MTQIVRTLMLDNIAHFFEVTKGTVVTIVTKVTIVTVVVVVIIASTLSVVKAQ